MVVGVPRSGRRRGGCRSRRSGCPGETGDGLLDDGLAGPEVDDPKGRAHQSKGHFDMC
jgi:hypothetical protein